jgi:hypothetical protein
VIRLPAGLYLERVLSDLMIVVMGMAETGRVIAIILDRIAGTETYKIVGVKALSGPELDLWRKGLP